MSLYEAPEEWDFLTSHATGTTYYLNKETKKWQWELPSGPTPLECLARMSPTQVNGSHVLVKHDERWRLTSSREEKLTTTKDGAKNIAKDIMSSKSKSNEEGNVEQNANCEVKDPLRTCANILCKMMHDKEDANNALENMRATSESDEEANLGQNSDRAKDDKLLTCAIIISKMLEDREDQRIACTTTMKPALKEMTTGYSPVPSTGMGHACKHCGKLYKSEETLKMHVNMKHPKENSEVDVYCTSCDKTYASPISLQRHRSYMHRHSHWCNGCYRSFETYDQLSEHATSCVRSKKPCSTCGKLFSSQLSLQNHVKNFHAEGKTNWCTVCRRSFLTDLGFLNHNAALHPSDIACDSCKKKFRSVTAMRRHVLYKHSKNSYRCYLCGKLFASYRGMSQHVVKNHNEIYDGGNYFCGVCVANFQGIHSLIQHVMERHSGVTGQISGDAIIPYFTNY